MDKRNKLLRNNTVQSLIASIVCIIVGLFIGYIVLLIINPSGAWGAITAVIKNFLYYPSKPAAIKYFGSTLVKAAPLIMCSLSVLFAYKAGLFNIGAAGQYVAGAGACLYVALAVKAPWWICLLAAAAAGAIFGAVSGALKAYCNVNEVISCIMLNWIGLYAVNMILSNVKEPASPYTVQLASKNPGALLPSMGLSSLFYKNQYVTIAIPLSIFAAILIWVVLDKTKFVFELKATGLNKFAARYCGMKEKKNLILTMVISGALAGLGAAFFYLSGMEQWSCTQTSVPGMGFNGIAGAFLGSLNPIGTIFSSYFIQHINSGGAYVDKTLYCAQISDFISAIIIYLCGFVFFFKLWMNRMLDKRDEKRAAASKKGGEA